MKLTKFITAVAYFPDGKRIVTAALDGLVKVWDATTCKLVLPLGGHEGGVLSLAFTPDGKTLFSRGMDHSLRRWDVPSRKEHDLLRIPFDSLSGVGAWGYPTTSLALSPCGRQLALVVEDQRIVQLVDTGAQKPRLAIRGHRTWAVRSASFSCDGALIASAEITGVRVWSAKTGQLVRALDVEDDPERERHKWVDFCAGFSPTRRLLAVGSGAGVQLWDVPSGTSVLTLKVTAPLVAHVAFSADGNLLAVAGGTKNPVVAVYEVATGALVGQFKLPEGTAHSAAFSPDGRFLAAGADGGKNAVRLWDVYTGQKVAALDGHSAGVLSVAFSPDGRLLASGSLDTIILLWDVRKAIGKRAAPADTEPLPEHCWDDLAGTDAKRGVAAVTALVRSPDRAVKLLKDKLKPSKEPDGERARTLISRLDDTEFAAREAASAELAKLGDVVRPAVKAALDKGPSAEPKRRLEALLAAIDQPRSAGGRLREVRAVQVLEAIASPQSRDLLEALSRGAPASGLTRDAKAALARSNRRPKE